MISLELALIGSLLLMPLTLGAVDAAQLLATRSRLDQALHQTFLIAYASNGNITSVTDEIDEVIGFLTGTAPIVVALPVQYCIMPTTGYPTTGTPLLAAAGVCTGGAQAQTYLDVTVSSTVTLAFRVPWVAQTVTLSTFGRARIS